MCKSGPAAEAATEAAATEAEVIEAVQFGVAPRIAAEQSFEGEQQL